MRVMRLAAICVVAMIGHGTRQARADELHVLAAGSLREVVGELVDRYPNPRPPTA